MESFIKFEKIWEDEDISELVITINDGNNIFRTNVYAGHQEIDDTCKELELFKNKIYGGITDINFGVFGPGYANGAFYANLHFVENKNGKLYITTKMQTEYFSFGNKEVAAEANLFLISEPALLDNFIKDFSILDKRWKFEATFECIKK